MITFSLNKEVLNDFIKDVGKIKEMLVTPNLNVYRANKFKQYTQRMVAQGQLGLKPIKDATKIIHGGNHPPEYATATLVDFMGVRNRPKANAADAGYFGDGTGKATLIKDDKSFTTIALLQHTGYRIPTTGEKGEKVRKFLAAKGVFDQTSFNFGGEKTKRGGWIVVEPRPFLIIAGDRYFREGEDIKVVNAFIDRILSGAPVQLLAEGEMLV